MKKYVFGKSVQMHNVFASICLINFCDFFLFFFSCFLNGRLKWYILMLMVCDAHVQLFLCTHICINKIPNKYHAYSHAVCMCVCVWSRMRKNENKSVKRKQSPRFAFIKNSFRWPNLFVLVQHSHICWLY